MTSQKQIEANRKNALLGGVKSEQGKQVSKMNAVKHGLTSKHIVNKEEKEIYDNVYSTLLNELSPQGFLEVMLVERIAFYYTKLQRIVSLDTKQVTIQRLLGEIKYLESDKPEAFPNLGYLGTDLSEGFEKLIEDLTSKIRKLEQGLVIQESINIFDKLHKYEGSIESRLYKSIETFYTIRSKK